MFALTLSISSITNTQSHINHKNILQEIFIEFAISISIVEFIKFSTSELRIERFDTIYKQSLG